MALNIKNEAVVSLAREVASLTGESLTDAIRHALEDRKSALQRESRSERIDRIMKLTEELRKELGPYRAGMTTDDLYDEETGLPI